MESEVTFSLSTSSQLNDLQNVEEPDVQREKTLQVRVLSVSSQYDFACGQCSP